MATNGAMAIEGGNWRIFAHMLEASSATTTHLNTTVTTISKQVDGTYNITTSSSTGETSTSTFDTVILAAPLQFSSLTIDPPPRHTPDKIPYVDLHVTLFATPHELDPTAFGLTPSEKVPQFILTTLPDGENHGSNPNGVGSPGFFSISIVSNGLNPHSSPKYRSEYIYKIFSAEKPSNGLFSRILGRTVELDNNDEGEGEGDGENVSWIYRKLWQSYPYEYPRVTFEEMELDDGLWYTSGIESFISTMETSALMGKNVARLVVDGWVGGRGESESGKELGTSDGERLRVQGEEEWQFEGLKDGKQRPVVAGL
jgi:prenylcysteine oxidase/farnesylcysteine lyase